LIRRFRKLQFILAGTVGFSPLLTQAAGPFDYIPMENIPGFERQATDFYQYISSVYKFGIWAIGIAALLMISIGGYMYITSAGNNSSMEKAKGVITDAIVGLVLALGAYLLLYVINPDLVKISKLKPVVWAPTTGTGAPAVGAPGTATAPTAGTGACSASKNSSATDTTLSCISSKPGLTLGQITTYQGSHACNLSANPPSISCHYGGRDCNGESNAIDYGGPGGAGGGSAYQNIVTAAQNCGVAIARCENSSGVKKNCADTSVDHVHITVLGSCGCS
jgi:hypothetical protein